MLYRKEFLQQTATIIGSYLGLSQLALKLLANESITTTDKTYLNFANTNQLTKLMYDIDSFGDPGEGIRISEEIFIPGIELLKFIELYSTEIGKRYNLKPDKNGYIEGIIFSKLNDTYLELIESLIKMFENIIFDYYSKAVRCAIQENVANVLYAELKDIYSAIQLSARKWRSDIFDNTDKVNKIPKSIILTSAAKYKKEYPVWDFDLTEIGRIVSDFITPDASEHFFFIVDHFNYILSHFRYSCKAIFSRYSILDSFEKHYELVSKDKEQITSNNEIISGSKQFISKIFFTLLFLELTINRMKLIGKRSRSGIFSNVDHEMFQIEFESLADTIKEIAERPAFSGKLLFDGGFEIKPVLINSDGILGKIKIMTINPYILGIQNSYGENTISVNTQDDSNHSIQILDKALEKLKDIRDKILGEIDK